MVLALNAGKNNLKLALYTGPVHGYGARNIRGVAFNDGCISNDIILRKPVSGGGLGPLLQLPARPVERGSSLTLESVLPTPTGNVSKQWGNEMGKHSLKIMLVAASLMATLAGQVSAADTVIVGTDGSYPPFASVGADGQLQGFDVDVAKAICASEKLECELRSIPFDGIFAALDAGKISVVIAGLNITEERKKKYAMPGPYLVSPLAYMTTEASTLEGTKEGLAGKTVGTVAASSFERYLNAAMGKTITVSTYESMDAAVLDLDAGRVDAVLGEVAQLQPAYVTAKPGTYKLIGETINDPTYSGLGKGMAVRGEDKTLAAAFDKGLAAIVADGTHAQLTKKWFGVEMSAK